MVAKKTEHIIRMENLHKSYFSGNIETKVLKGIHLEVKRGDFIAIMGPSGSGKSTLINIIGFLDKANTGTYYLDGVEMEHVKDSELALIRNKKIGFVFQSFNLLPRISAVENVALPLLYAGVTSRKEREERAKEVLASLGLGDKFRNKPNELSGGQQQRVSIARALINNPSIILADEPTGAIDTKTSNEIMKIFQDIHAQGRTIIMITHEKDIAKYAERTLHLRDGIFET